MNFSCALANIKETSNLFFFKFFKKSQVVSNLNLNPLLDFFRKNIQFFYRNNFNVNSFVTFGFFLTNFLSLNKNIFIFNSSNQNLNCNCLNFNFFKSLTFNKNFFFLFFKISWLRSEKNKKHFFLFLRDSNVKCFFFFNLKVNSQIEAFFFNRSFVTCGITIPNKKASQFDYPIFVKHDNIYNNYIIYSLITKIITNNNKRLNLPYKGKTFYFSFFYMGLF